MLSSECVGRDGSCAVGSENADTTAAEPNPRALLRVRIAAAQRHWQLSERQRDVLVVVARGDSNKAVSEELSISEATVEAHITALLRRTGATSRTDLAVRVWSGAFDGVR